MKTKIATLSTIDDYGSQLDEKGQTALEEFRILMKKIVPQCAEKMSYGMPAFDYKGILVWFAVWKTHYGFYPSAKPIVVFNAQLKNYKTSKGCIQLPMDKPLPKKLITEIVKFRVQENLEKEKNAILKKANAKRKK